MKVYLDANFFVFIRMDKTQKGDKAGGILKDIVEGKKEAVTSTLALDEVMWTFIKNKRKEEIRNFLEELYQVPHLTITTGSTLLPLRAIDFIERYNLKPRDACHLAIMQEEHIEVIVSDDSDFDRVKFIKRIRLA